MLEFICCGRLPRIGFFFLGAFLLNFNLLAQEKTGTSSTSKNSIDVISRGDRLWKEGEYRQAIAIYQSVLKGNEDEVLWRISRLYSDWGEALPRDRQEETYDRAVEYGRLAVKAAPRLGQSHAILAMALGKKALFVRGKQIVALSKEVKDEADQALELDPDNVYAYIVLGIWNREVANLGFFQKAAAKLFFGGIPKGSNERSVAVLKKAISLSPDALKARLELGRTYLNMGEEKKARQQFEEVLKRPKYIALDLVIKAEAKKALEEI